MNQREFKYSQYELRYQIDSRRCGKCGLPATHMSHRISQSKMNIKKYGYKIIHHIFNLVPACGQLCNDCWNINNKSERIKKLIDLILYRGNEKLTSYYITGYLNE